MAAPPAQDADLVLPRTYASALHLLSLLPTNRDTTALFESASPAAPTSQNSSSGSPSTASSALTASFPTATSPLNALAIPEMHAWLARAGLPSHVLAPSSSGMRVVHVAGTKGKGSTCAFITALLTHRPSAKGRSEPVGTYMSPHVASVRERILLDGKPVDKKLFAAGVFEIWQRLAGRSEAVGGSEGEWGVGKQGGKLEVSLAPPGFPVPFYFRFLTLVALHIFLREKVRSAVVECGIGGEFDSTNSLPDESTSVSVITPLGLDHVAMLGNTVGEIAWHKAGVLKKGRVGVSAAQVDEAAEVLRARAEERGAVLSTVGGSEKCARVQGARLAGEFQRANMALAVEAAREHLRVLGEDAEGLGREEEVPEWAIDALKGAGLRGRCEQLTTAVPAAGEGDLHTPTKVEWFLDGAHTVESVSVVAGEFLGNSNAGDGWQKKPRTDEREIRILLFAQQARDPVPLVHAVLGGQVDKSSDYAPYDFAVFTLNEIPSSSKESKGPTPEEQKALEVAAAAMRKESPLTWTTIEGDVSSAVRHVEEFAAKENGKTTILRVLVTGSFHLVRAVLKVLQPDEVE